MTSNVEQLSTPPKDEQHLTSTDQVSELSNDIPTQIFPPTCNSTDFIENVVRILKARHRRRLWTMFFILILLILLTIVCSDSLARDNYVVMVVFLTLLLPATIVLPIVLLISCCYYSSIGKHTLRLINNVQHTLQLTGELWHKQVDSLRTVPYKLIGFCNNYKYQRLKNRLYGNIILAEKGIMIDELYLIDYGAIFVANITPIIDGTGSVVLRMHLVTRIYVVGTFHKGRPDEFDLDLFMPSNLQAQELVDISQRILLNSRFCPVNFFYV